MILTAILLLNGSLTLLSILSVLALRQSTLPTTSTLPAPQSNAKGYGRVAYSGA